MISGNYVLFLLFAVSAALGYIDSKDNKKPRNGFDFIPYPAHKKIKVRMSELSEDLLCYSLLMVDVLSSRKKRIDTLDFRSDIASYIPKEAYPEN